MATSVLMQGKAEKAAGDTVRIACDFGDVQEIIDGARISSYNITCSGLSVTAKQKDYYYQISALVSGGTAGTAYEIVYAITLDDADSTVISRTGVVKVL